MLSGEVGEVVGVECRGEGCGRGLSEQVLFVGKDMVVEEIRRESAACWIVESRASEKVGYMGWVIAGTGASSGGGVKGLE